MGVDQVLVKNFLICTKTYNVIATYRDSKPKKNSKNLYKLDMSQQKEVRKFVNWLALRKIKIDCILLIAAKTGSNNKLSNIHDKTVFSKGLSIKQLKLIWK